MTTKAVRKGHVRTDSAKTKRKVQVFIGKVAANPEDVVLAEKPILRALRRVRRKAQIERFFS